MFEVNKSYSKQLIYEILGVPKKLQRGNWDTGYHIYNDNVFIFANIETAGRTGHNYFNHWSGDRLVWYCKNRSHIEQPTVQKLLNPSSRVYIFIRTNARLLFTFAGQATMISYSNTTPVCIKWGFYSNNLYPDEILEFTPITEGAIELKTVNRYERSLLARELCIKHYGYNCQICNLNFENFYGEIGLHFTHIHHLKPLATIGEKYIVDPIKDLIPVCPNCHAMIHRRTPPFTVEELSYKIQEIKNFKNE